MGKKKLESISKIQDKNSRNVTYCKRKRGLIKKAMELSKLCDQKIYLAIYDKEKQRLVEYKSTNDFTCKLVHHLSQEKYKQFIRLENYDNTHYPQFEKNLPDPREKDDPTNAVTLNPKILHMVNQDAEHETLSECDLKSHISKFDKAQLENN